MDLSIFLFRIFGFYMVLIGLACIFKKDFFAAAIENYYKNPGLILITGAFTLILGLLIVLNYSVWEFSAKGVVTFLGWATLLKGITRIFLPYWGENFAAKMLSGPYANVLGTFWVVIGAWLLYSGYA